MTKFIYNFIVLLIFCYLLGSFIGASFDISKWDFGLRFGIAFFGSIFSAVIAGFLKLHYNE